MTTATIATVNGIARDDAAPILEVSASDRCDSCIQPAVSSVLVSTDLPTLFFCGHHFRKYAATFAAQGYRTNAPDWVHSYAPEKE